MNKNCRICKNCNFFNAKAYARQKGYGSCSFDYNDKREDSTCRYWQKKE